MTLNCKVGDLARVTAQSRHSENIDRILSVVRPYQEGEVLPGHPLPYNMQSGVFPWVVESRGAPLRSDNGWFAQVAIRDEVLRPIHDPGDDAQDETLAWLPSPAKQGEPA